MEILPGYLHVVVMAGYVEAAFGRQAFKAFGVENELFQLAIYIFFVGQDVDDGAQFLLLDYLIIFRFTSTDEYQSFAHCYEGVHGRGVGVELVEDGIGGVHQVLVFFVGHRFGLDNLTSVRVCLVEPFECA